MTASKWLIVVGAIFILAGLITAFVSRHDSARVRRNLTRLDGSTGESRHNFEVRLQRSQTRQSRQSFLV